MYYEFLKLTLIVKILKLENILCEKQLFTTLNREPLIPMPFLFWKLSYFTFKYDKYLLFHEKKTDYFRISTRREKFCAIAVQALGHTGFLCTSR